MNRLSKLHYRISIVGLVAGILLFSTISINIAAYGYLKITSPAKGQEVPAGNIVISGTSLSNATNHCTVSLNINGIKPSQNATAAGHNGSNDYSKWTFISTPKYAVIKEGFNKITAKYSCPQIMSPSRFYSVNVTGVDPSAAVTSGAHHQIHANTNITSNPLPPLLPRHYVMN